MSSVKTPPKRLTREESRAETRRRLVDAARELFTSQGFDGTSVEQIAERAGYTRGAFYSNFDDKDDVFLELYDQRMAAEIDEISGLMHQSASPAEMLETLRARSERTFDVAWQMLSTELWLYAMRNPRARPKFVARMRRLREAYGRAIQAQFAAAGVALPAPLENMAIILHALDEAIPAQHAIDPKGVRRDFFFDAIALLFESAVALSKQQQAS
jgi:AcrR family transcriptional regulator